MSALKIDAFYRRDALYIQNGFACGEWNDTGKGIVQLCPFNVTENGEIDLSTAKFVEVERDLKPYLLKANDVIFNNTNSEELVGKTALWTKEQKAVLSNHMTIVRVLSTVQSAIEQQARLIALTRELKSALIRKLFTEGLRGEKQKEMEIGLVPESWEVVELDELLPVTQYGLSVRGDSEGKYPILRMTNQVNGKIVANNLQFVNIPASEFDKFRVSRGDILFNRTNSFELVGRTAIFDLDGDFVFTSYLIRMRTNAERLNPFFLNHYFNWNGAQTRLKSIATRAVSQSNISATRLRTFVIPLPTIQEQTEIVSQLNTVDQKIELHALKKTLLEELFRTSLHQLMTVQIRVKDDVDLTSLKDL